VSLPWHLGVSCRVASWTMLDGNTCGMRANGCIKTTCAAPALKLSTGRLNVFAHKIVRLCQLACSVPVLSVALAATGYITANPKRRRGEC